MGYLTNDAGAIGDPHAEYKIRFPILHYGQKCILVRLKT